MLDICRSLESTLMNMLLHCPSPPTPTPSIPLGPCKLLVLALQLSSHCLDCGQMNLLTLINWIKIVVCYGDMTALKWKCIFYSRIKTDKIFWYHEKRKKLKQAWVPFSKSKHESTRIQKQPLIIFCSWLCYVYFNHTSFQNYLIHFDEFLMLKNIKARNTKIAV